MHKRILLKQYYEKDAVLMNAIFTSKAEMTSFIKHSCLILKARTKQKNSFK